MHCIILGDLQEKFKVFPETSRRLRSIIVERPILQFQASARRADGTLTMLD
jgi:hypothetical protein